MIKYFTRLIKRKLLWEKRELLALEGALQSFPSRKTPLARSVVLIDIPDHANELIEQLAFARFFESQGSQPRTYYPSIYLAGDSGLVSFVRRLVFSYSRGLRLARKMGVGHGLDHAAVNPEMRRQARREAENLYSSLKSKAELLDYRVEGVALGVAVYDTYLRLYSRPTLDLDNPILLKLIYQAFLNLYAVKSYFSRNTVRAVVLGHAVYNNWKILSDYAVSRGVNVYVTYNSRFAPMHHVNAHRGLQTTDHSAYKSAFSSMPADQQDLCRNEGLQLMSKRLSGHLDEGLSYMASSAYGQDGKAGAAIPLHPGKQPLVMMLHSFFDSPHIYKDMIFEDFWAWCIATLEYVRDRGLADKYQLILKPHPNRLEGEDEIIDELVARFPFVTRLTGGESNNSIMECKPAAIITVYGTVAAEFAFAGVPVITCGDNPTSSFSFCFQAAGPDEYFRLLENANTLAVTKTMQSEVGEYAYMHYMQAPVVGFNEYPFKRYRRAADIGRFVSRIHDFDYAKFKTMVERALAAQ